MKQLTLFRWRLLTHPPRRLLVACSSCGHAAVNESNALHRDGWTETVGTPRAYRCGDCSRKEPNL